MRSRLATSHVVWLVRRSHEWKQSSEHGISAKTEHSTASATTAPRVDAGSGAAELSRATARTEAATPKPSVAT